MSGHRKSTEYVGKLVCVSNVTLLCNLLLFTFQKIPRRLLDPNFIIATHANWQTGLRTGLATIQISLLMLSWFTDKIQTHPAYTGAWIHHANITDVKLCTQSITGTNRSFLSFFLYFFAEEFIQDSRYSLAAATVVATINLFIPFFFF